MEKVLPKPKNGREKREITNTPVYKTAPKRRKGEEAPDPIEQVNKKSDEAFIQEHLCPSNPDWTRWTHPRTQKYYSIELRGTAMLADEDLEACYSLIEETSRVDYEASTTGWDREKKITEMRSPELRYILVRETTGERQDGIVTSLGNGENGGHEIQNGRSAIRGFTSLMPTYEVGEPVCYCYEIHIKPELRGTGLGKLLMSFHESVAAHTPPIQKVMLTCFVANKKAFTFYRALGFEVDPLTPVPRPLRSGKTTKPVDYAIMSKKVSRARMT